MATGQNPPIEGSDKYVRSDRYRESQESYPGSKAGRLSVGYKEASRRNQRPYEGTEDEGCGSTKSLGTGRDEDR